MPTVWKLHVSQHFIDDPTLLGPGNGVGKGGTVFLDYDYMLMYARASGVQWHVAEIEAPIELLFRIDDKRALAFDAIESAEGFKLLVFSEIKNKRLMPSAIKPFFGPPICSKHRCRVYETGMFYGTYRCPECDKEHKQQKEAKAANEEIVRLEKQIIDLLKNKTNG